MKLDFFKIINLNKRTSIMISNEYIYRRVIKDNIIIKKNVVKKLCKLYNM